MDWPQSTRRVSGRCRRASIPLTSSSTSSRASARSWTSGDNHDARRFAAPPRTDRRLRPLRSASGAPDPWNEPEVLDMMTGLKLYGMRSAYDETLATAIKRKHEHRSAGRRSPEGRDLRRSRRARSNTSSPSPSCRWPSDVDDFTFKDTPINEALVRDLAGGGFIAQQRNVVLVEVEPAPARRIWPPPSREAASELDRAVASSPPSISSISSRPRAVQAAAKDGSPITSRCLDFVILDELGYLPFAQAGGQLLFHLINTVSTSAPQSSSRPTSPSANGRARVRRSKNDDRPARPSYSSL